MSVYVCVCVNTYVIIFKIYFRIITLQYYNGFCHISTWIGHRYTCVPLILNPPPTFFPHPIPLGCPRALALGALFHTSNLHWPSVLHMIVYMFQCKSLSRVQLFVTPWTVAHQAPPFMGFSKQEYWSGLPFPSPGDLPNPGIEPRSPTLQADTLNSEPPGKLSKLPYDPAYPTAGHTPQGNQNWKRYMYPNVHCNTVYNS